MPRPIDPFNLNILNLTKERRARIKQVTALDYFEGSTKNFDPDGLFSVEIFGNVGSSDRDNRFGYVDIKIDVIHPFILKNILTLRGLYQDIIQGRAYVTWNETTLDFDTSDAVSGHTGYHYFLKYWRSIVFKKTPSKLRDQKIELIERYKAVSLTNAIIVIPAGLRDLSVDETGRIKESEINGFYRALMAITNTVANSGVRETAVLDTTRVSLQNTFNKIYEFFYSLISGKGGFIQSKYTSRNIFYGTRNVITANTASINELGAPNVPGCNSTVVGMHQVLYAIQPFVRHYLLKEFSAHVFSAKDAHARLINRATLRAEMVQVPSEIIDKWTTTTGIDKIIKVYHDHRRRNKPVIINDSYLALVYQDAKYYKVFFDIQDFPEGTDLDPSCIRPITYIEMFYLCGVNEWNKFPASITRYPVAGSGSIYDSTIYIKTTNRARMLMKLGDDWKPMVGDEHLALEYPNVDYADYVDSMSVHPSKLIALRGDHDGDMTSLNAKFTDEARAENTRLMGLAKSYIDTSGQLAASANVDTVSRVIYCLSSD